MRLTFLGDLFVGTGKHAKSNARPSKFGVNAGLICICPCGSLHGGSCQVALQQAFREGAFDLGWNLHRHSPLEQGTERSLLALLDDSRANAIEEC